MNFANSQTLERDVNNLQLANKSIVGDFDGDGRKDTLNEILISFLDNNVIQTIPNYYKNDDNEIENWLNKRKTRLCLIFKSDTLLVSDNFADSYNLYCLINLGDLNKDGKDEIAFVVNYLDVSSINSCKIYSYCNGKWELKKRFTIHEDAFDKKFKNGIKGFLEKRKNKWFYTELENDEKIKILHLEKCK